MVLLYEIDALCNVAIHGRIPIQGIFNSVSISHNVITLVPLLCFLHLEEISVWIFQENLEI